MQNGTFSQKAAAPKKENSKFGLPNKKMPKKNSRFGNSRIRNLKLENSRFGLQNIENSRYGKFKIRKFGIWSAEY